MSLKSVLYSQFCYNSEELEEVWELYILLVGNVRSHGIFSNHCLSLLFGKSLLSVLYQDFW